MKQLFLLPILIATTMSFAQTAPVPSEKILAATLQQKTFSVPTNECSLSRFSFLYRKMEDKNQNGGTNTHRTTSVGFVVGTSDLSCLKDFAVVQFIRGCSFGTFIDPITKKPYQRINITRDFKGVPLYPFKHPEWTVDTVDVDPMYYSNPYDSSPEHRFDPYRIIDPEFKLTLQSTPAAIKADFKLLENRKYWSIFAYASPTTPSYFIADHPITAFVASHDIQNTSFEFKTCVYRTKDVPTSGDPIAEPLHCFEWKHQNIFNLKTKKFESPAQIAPICLQ